QLVDRRSRPQQEVGRAHLVLEPEGSGGRGEKRRSAAREEEKQPVILAEREGELLDLARRVLSPRVGQGMRGQPEPGAAPTFTGSGGDDDPAFEPRAENRLGGPGHGHGGPAARDEHEAAAASDAPRTPRA